MEILGLPQWTLSARLEGDGLEFSLGDGRRLAWRARRPARLLQHAQAPIPAAELLGAELAERLAGSAPRVLKVVNEPQNPMVRKARRSVAVPQAGKARIRKPSRTDPVRFTRRVAQGKPLPDATASQEPTAWRERAPSTPPAAT